MAEQRELIKRPIELSFEEGRERFLNILEQRFLLAREQTDQGMIMTVFLEGIDNLDFKEVKRRFKQESAKTVYVCPAFTENKATALMNAFRDQNVVSVQEYRAWLQDRSTPLEPRPLFYAPKTADEAFSIDAIKKAKFYRVPWKISSQDPERYAKNYPSLQPGEQANATEVALAAVTYHPSFGDGERGEDGTLTVIDPVTHERHPITSEFYTKHYSFFRQQRGAEAITMHSPVRYLNAFAPQLIDRGLLLLSDFKIQSGSKTSDKYRTERYKIVPDAGTIMFDGIRYYLGRDLGGQKVHIYKISETLAGIGVIQEGSEELQYVFTLTTKDNPKLKYREPDNYFDASQAVTNRRPYNAAELHKRNLDESDAAYQERIGQLNNFDHFITFSRELSAQAGINLSQLDVRTQLWASRSAELLHHKKPEIIAFAKQFGLEGLQAFLSAEYGTEMGERILGIAELGERAQPIFAEYAQLIQLVSSVQMKEAVSLQQRQAVQEGVLRQGKELLVAASYIAAMEQRGQLPPVSIADVAETMQSYKQYIAEKQGKGTDGAAAPSKPFLPDLSGHRQLSGVVHSHFVVDWEQRSRRQAEDAGLRNVIADTVHFYTTYEEMNKEAAQLNADTQFELSRTTRFLESLPPGSTVLDGGCGDLTRITIPLAQQRPDLNVIGVDIRPVAQSELPNLEVKQDDLTQLSTILDQSCDAVLLMWSVANDILKVEDQQRMWQAIRRVLKPGGRAYIDIPYREGGVGSYEEHIHHFYNVHAAEGATPGMLQLDLPRGDGSRIQKQVYIYQLQEITTQLAEAGLTWVNPVMNQPDLQSLREGNAKGTDDAQQSPAWRTSAGRPRVTLIAQANR